MCGIAGILRVHPPGTPPPPPELAIPESWLDILDDSIKHRGPDGQGRFRDRAVRADGSVVDVAFVHRRLSILDHAGGAQPMVSTGKLAATASAATFEGMPLPVIFHGKPNDEVRYRPLAPATTDGLVAVVFNGCIYNHRKLRKELQAAGHVFESDHSDTEVLVHGWREWGRELPNRLDGMFAFAIWDRSRSEVILCRDRAGEKPLYRAGCSFGSSLAGPIQLSARQGQALQRSISLDNLGDWVRYGALLYTPWPHAGSRDQPGVEEVYPGGLWRFGGESDCGETASSSQLVLEHGRYADPFDGVASTSMGYPRRGDRGDLGVAEVEEILERSVISRLETDVPLACFLSGGLDSSLIAAMVQRHLALAGSRLRTLTVRMPDDRSDESEIAAKVAQTLGTDHTILDVSPHPAQDLRNLISQLGLPFGDSSLLPTFWVSNAAREHAKVALSGDGGDELFGGYERHVAAQIGRRWGRLLSRLPISDTPRAHPKSRLHKLYRLVSAARWQGYRDLRSIFPTTMFGALVGKKPRHAPDWPDDPLRVDFAHKGFGYLPADILRKTDTASMAVALEVRAPMLASENVDACLGASLHSLMPHNQRKGLLRAVARKYFPAEIVDRPKQGFAIPIGEWFRSDYGGMKQLLLDHLNSAEPWGSPALGIDLNMKFVRQMLDEHMGTGMSGRVTRDHSQRLYMLLVLSIWAKWLSSLK